MSDRHRRLRLFLSIPFILAISLFAFACDGDNNGLEVEPQVVEPQIDVEPPREDAPVTAGTADIERVSVEKTAPDPQQVTVIVEGNYRDGCSTTDEIIQRREGNTFIITLTTARQPGVACTEAPVPFVETIPLDVRDAEDGVYSVSVNGVDTRFALGEEEQEEEQVITGDAASVDEVLVEMPSTDPGQVTVIARGTFPDACTTIGEVARSRQNNTFIIALITARPVEALCTQRLVAFEEEIVLDVSDLPGGTYTVSVNGVEQQFALGGVGAGVQTGEQPAMVVHADGLTPGERVQITAANLPPNKPVTIAMGPVDGEYEVFVNAVTDNQGELTTGVTVPDFAQPGQFWVFALDTGEAQLASRAIPINQ